jgi:bifunctional non-homologous end joining protein LigD
VLRRFEERGDAASGIDDAAGSLHALLRLAEELGPAEKAPTSSDGSGRRKSTMPLIEIARAETKPEALEGLERWKAKHPDVVPLLQPADVLVDGMRGSSSLWYRIRVNLQHVPETKRPKQEELEVDYDPWAGKA